MPSGPRRPLQTECSRIIFGGIGRYVFSRHILYLPLPPCGRWQARRRGSSDNLEGNSCIMRFKSPALKARQREPRTKSEDTKPHAICQSPPSEPRCLRLRWKMQRLGSSRVVPGESPKRTLLPAPRPPLPTLQAESRGRLGERQNFQTNDQRGDPFPERGKWQFPGF